MSQAGKRQRWTRGAVVKIELGDLGVGYGQMLAEPEYAFFAETDPGAGPTDVVNSPVLFRLWVDRKAYSSGRWLKLGTAPLTPELSQPVLRFNQDPREPGNILLGYDGVSGRACTVEECVGYERAAVWAPEHVEERLAAHRSGRESDWARLLQPSRP